MGVGFLLPSLLHLRKDSNGEDDGKNTTNRTSNKLAEHAESEDFKGYSKHNLYIFIQLRRKKVKTQKEDVCKKAQASNQGLKSTLVQRPRRHEQKLVMTHKDQVKITTESFVRLHPEPQTQAT